MPSPNNATIQGNAPNPGGKDPDLDNDPISSDHLQCGNVPESTELLAYAMSRLVDFVTKDKEETLSAKVQDPDPFNGSNPKKLRGFLLECKLKFQAQPKAFHTENAKVNYAMSFLNQLLQAIPGHTRQ